MATTMKVRANGFAATAHQSGILEWQFPNSGIPSVVFHYRQRAEGERMADFRAMVHGYTQKIADAAALGQGATVAQRAAAMRRVASRLSAGFWDQDPIYELAVAWVRVKGSGDESAVYDKLRGATKEQLAALAAKPDVRAELLAIRGEQEAEPVDVSDLEAELMA